METCPSSFHLYKTGVLSSRSVPCEFVTRFFAWRHDATSGTGDEDTKGCGQRSGEGMHESRSAKSQDTAKTCDHSVFAVAHGTERGMGCLEVRSQCPWQLRQTTPLFNCTIQM